MKKFLTTLFQLLIIVGGSLSLTAQCTSPTSFGGAAANNSGLTQTLTTCAFGGEFSPYSAVVMGNTYSFTATGGAGNFITVRQTNGTGTLVASGLSPLTGVVSPISGTLAVIVHVNATCTTDSDCHTITANCTSCTPPPPPANDLCSAAIAFPTITTDGMCATVTANTNGATGTADAFCTGTEDDDVWFSFTTPAGVTSLLYINTNISGNTDRVLQIYSGACPGATIVGACYDPETGTITGLTGSTAYLLRAYTWSSGVNSNFTICLRTPPPPPANDECANAITLTVNPDLNCGTVTPGTIASATGTADATCTGTEDDDVWFKFTATATSHKIDLLNVAGSTTDLVHQVLSACGGTNLLCSDPNTSTVSGLTIGSQYILRVYSWTSTTGQTTTFNVCIGTLPPPPANDNCAGATSLTVNADFNCGVTTSGTTVSATASVEAAPSCSATGVDDDVWYSFVATGAQHRVSISNATSTSAIAIYTGACGALTQITGACGTSSLDLTGLTVGTTYRVRVYTTSSTVGTSATFTLCVGTPPPVPANDLCANAIALGCGQTLTGYTVSSTLDNAGTCVTSNTAPGVWYAFIGNGGTATISLCGSTLDTKLSVFTGSCGSFNCVTGNDDACGLQSIVTFATTPCVTYYVLVHGFSSNVGNFTIAATCTAPPAPPANDVCSGATSVTCGSLITGNTTTATTDAAMGACGIGSGGTPGLGLWYKLVGNGAQVTLSLCGSSFNTKVHVYSGACGTLSCVASNDDAAGCSSNRSIAIFNANVGVDYYILVSGVSSCDLGAFSMDISCLCGPNLSFPWTVSNIGGSIGNGIDNVCNGTIDISASNYGTPSSDVQTFASQQFCGNFTITAKLESVTNLGWGGLMVRETSAPGSKKVALRTQLNSLFVRDLRATTNGVELQQQWFRPTHSWMRITRTGNTFIGYTSFNGVLWQQAFIANLVLPTCIDAGLFAQSINVNTPTLAAFSNLGGFDNNIPNITDQNTANRSIETEKEFSVYPNPASDEINVKWISGYNGKAATITLTNQLGQTVATQRIGAVSSEVETINVSQLANGMYILSVQTEDKQTQYKKFMVSGLRP